MDNEPKINLAKIYAWKFLDAHKEFGADEHEKLTQLFREYRTEIEKEFEAGNKRYTRIDEDYSLRSLVERIQQVQRDCPNILACTTERKFDNPEEIKED